MKVLLLGATGHTGERFARSLLADGHEVRVLSRKDASNPTLSGLIQAGAKHFEGDANRRWTVWRALEGCDALASCAHIRHAAVCVQACRHLGVSRYIQMSSTRGLSRFDNHPSVREVRAGERAIRESGLVYTIIRPTMIYGGERDANIEKLARWFRKRRWFPLFGKGDALVQPVYVDDVVYTLAASLSNPDAAGRKTFSIGGKAPLSHREMAAQVCQAVRGTPPCFLHFPRKLSLHAAKLTGMNGLAEMIERIDEDKNVVYTEAAEDLGYTPLSFTEGLEEKWRVAWVSRP